MSFLEIIMFLVSVPGCIIDFVQLLEWITTYYNSKKKAKGTSQKANANKH